MSGRATDFDRAIAARLRERRKEIGMTLAELAEQLDCSYQQLGKRETGQNRISAGDLAQTCQILRMDVTEALYGSDMPPGPAPHERQTMNMLQDFRRLSEDERDAIAQVVRVMARRGERS